MVKNITGNHEILHILQCPKMYWGQYRIPLIHFAGIMQIVCKEQGSTVLDTFHRQHITGWRAQDKCLSHCCCLLPFFNLALFLCLYFSSCCILTPLKTQTHLYRMICWLLFAYYYTDIIILSINTLKTDLHWYQDLFVMKFWVDFLTCGLVSIWVLYIIHSFLPTVLPVGIGSSFSSTLREWWSSDSPLVFPTVSLPHLYTTQTDQVPNL